MKHAMVTRESLGKKSTFLRNRGFSYGGQSQQRSDMKATSEIPNSTKIGGGKHVHRIRSSKQMRKN